MRERQEKARRKGRKPGERLPQAPTPSPRDEDQYNFTDPDSRIMNAPRSTDEGFDQHYNAQAVVDQASLFIVATTLSNHLHDRQEAKPAVEAISAELGQPKAAALDNGYWSPTNVLALEPV